ncbi:hypothetical protein TCON_0376 [Astathelohania contejeani]|uniref:Uncharacterized protein n=1 Tax=Astathelohania contejeani TaxID=164912 RepID=A0ABQ7I1Z7_9MICR|nr:hypothetical protein TCON_0376 [Thelohania contejeani]
MLLDILLILSILGFATVLYFLTTKKLNKYTSHLHPLFKHYKDHQVLTHSSFQSIYLFTGSSVPIEFLFVFVTVSKPCPFYFMLGKEKETVILTGLTRINWMNTFVYLKFMRPKHAGLPYARKCPQEFGYKLYGPRSEKIAKFCRTYSVRYFFISFLGEDIEDVKGEYGTFYLQAPVSVLGHPEFLDSFQQLFMELDSAPSEAQIRQAEKEKTLYIKEIQKIKLKEKSAEYKSKNVYDEKKKMKEKLKKKMRKSKVVL